jgi:hypothetical protein
LFARPDTKQERPDRAPVFGVAAALGAGGMLAAVVAVATAIDSVHQASDGSPRIAIAGLRFSYPSRNAAAGLLFALAALGAAAVGVAVLASWRQCRAYRRFIAGISVRRSSSFRVCGASLGAVAGLSGLIWRASEAASAHATFDLPLLSSRPCLAILTPPPLVGCLAMLARRERGRREARRSSHLAITR